MTANASIPPEGTHMSRREFLKAGAAAGVAAGALSAQPQPQAAPAAPGARPNFIVICCDQLSLDAISGYGNRYVHTPNLDRLIARGVSFMESHSTNPVCSPARSSLMTGRMPVETGVVSNARPITDGMPNLGEWFRRHGYETVYCGKWHLPEGWAGPRTKGFDTLPTGRGGEGDQMDELIARHCENYLAHRSGTDPFVLVASFLQPHDICYWAIEPEVQVPRERPFEIDPALLPPLPPNNKSRPRAPRQLDQLEYKAFNDEQWRYYLYIYYRMVEMLDADVGRLLDALERSPYADNTMVVFTSDHGEGGGRHSHVQKWYPYEESVKVPFIVTFPGRAAENHLDRKHLVSGLDLINTMCDYAGIEPPPHARGLSLRPLLEGRDIQWREFVASEHHMVGHMIRTEEYKYVKYEGDPIEQLFDMVNDPWETKNLFDDARYASVMTDHRKLLDAWNGHMIVTEPTPFMP